MNSVWRIFKAVAYLPLLPCNFKLLVLFLRCAGWLPTQPVFSAEVRRILVVQPHNSLGDLVLSIPFLDEIHNRWPQAEIDIITGNAMSSLFRHITYIRRIIEYTPSSSRPPLARYRDTLSLLLLRHRGIPEPYNVAIDPRWDSDGYAYLARAMLFLSGAPIRVAYSGNVDGVDPSLDEFVTHRALGGRNEHESLRKLRLLHRAGLSERFAESVESLRANATLSNIATLCRPELETLFLGTCLQSEDRYAVLAPSASAPVRIWPVENLAECARTLHDKYGLQFVIVGSSREVGLCERTAASCSGYAISLAGKTSILQLLALLQRAAIFVGNDSGPAHLSAMIGTPTVVATPIRIPPEVLDHVNAPRRFRPWGPQVRLVQPARPLPPCDPVCIFEQAHCITQVATHAILAACDDLLLTDGVEHEKEERSGGDLRAS